MVVSREQRPFTASGPGTPAAVWRRHPQWGTAPAAGLEGVTRLVVVAAHPDDESLGAGGLVATAAEAGLEVAVVCATDGELSHPDSPTRTPEDLAAVRAEEGRAAARAMGVERPVLRLGLPDGSVAEHVHRLTAELVEVVGDGRSTVLVAPWRQDGHPDHEAAGRSAAAAARRTGADLWEYPVWFWHWGAPDQAPWPALHPFHLDEHARSAKLAAVRAHASQVAPLSSLAGDEALLTPALLAHFDGSVEHYLTTASALCPDDVLDRLHHESPDPWGVDTRFYERRKRDLVLAALPRPRFERALEVGCSTGALAEALQPRAGRVVAVDRSPAALAAARARLAGLESVTVTGLDVPHQWPEDVSFDLVVVSEMGYFLSPREVELLVDRVAAALDPEGVVVLCHWLHPVQGWVLDAARVHEAFEDPRLPPLAATYRDRDVEIRVHAADSAWPDPQQ